MHFIIGAKIADSITNGMGRQMHGLGDALVAQGHSVEYLFTDTVGVRLGRTLSRLEFPLQLARCIAANSSNGSGETSIAILHEPVAWPTAVFLKNRVRTLAMVHACEARCWQVKMSTRKVTGEQISVRSRLMSPIAEVLQTVASLKTADGVLCLSTEDRDYITRRLGVASDRVARIDNGIEPAFLGLPFPERPPERDLLFMGSWIPRKGRRILTAALERLTSAGIFAKLTLAGTGTDADDIRAELVEPWRSSAEILPYVPADRLVDVYRRHRILVLPSILEGIPLVILEAMACGLTVVASAVGGMPDVIRNAETGVLVPPLDATVLADVLAYVLADERGDARSMARRAHDEVQAYGWGRAAEQVERLCATLFGSDRRSRAAAPLQPAVVT